MLIYAAIGAVGFLILLVMLVLGDIGGGDHEVSAHEAVIDHADSIDPAGPSVFSVRIMAAFITAFGVGGVIGRYYQLSHPAASGVGVVAGIGMAAVVYQFAKMLFSQQASSEVRVATLIGRTAEVSVAIPPAGVGQVTLVASGERLEHIARARDGLAMARGTEVIVTGLRGDSLIVAPASTEAPRASGPGAAAGARHGGTK
jgi:membrane protein implicated in regulation of membrane protease activity